MQIAVRDVRGSTDRAKPAFDVIRLQSWNENGWAVIRRATGAIAVDPNGELLMRLTVAEARRTAEDLSESAARGEISAT